MVDFSKRLRGGVGFQRTKPADPKLTAPHDGTGAPVPPDLVYEHKGPPLRFATSGPETYEAGAGQAFEEISSAAEMIALADADADGLAAAES